MIAQLAILTARSGTLFGADALCAVAPNMAPPPALFTPTGGQCPTKNLHRPNQGLCKN